MGGIGGGVTSGAIVRSGNGAEVAEAPATGGRGCGWPGGERRAADQDESQRGGQRRQRKSRGACHGAMVAAAPAGALRTGTTEWCARLDNRGMTEPRARDLGIRIGLLEPGPLNAITDVPGVRVGHTTIVTGDGPLVVGQGPVRTGVTVIVPGGEPFEESFFAGCHRLNGNGELTGLEWVRESGMLTTPIAITNTHSVGVVRDALITAADPTRAARRRVVTAGGGRDVRRAAQRHGRPARPSGARVRGARGRGRGSGRGGQRRRRHGHDLPRVQGRHRDVVPGAARGRRRLDGRRPGPGQLRPARTADHRWHPGRSGHPDDRRAQRLGRHPDRAHRATGPPRGQAPTDRRAPARSSSSWPPTRRSCPTSASGWRSGPAWASRVPVGPAAHSSGDLFLCFATGNRSLTVTD